MATRAGRQARTPSGWNTYEKGANSYEELFASLFCTSCHVEGLEIEMAELPARDRATSENILLQLYRRGRIAYHIPTKTFLPYWGENGQNAYGYYKTLTLWGQNGTTKTVSAKDCYTFRANPFGSALIAQVVRQRAQMLSTFDAEISRNLDDIKAMTVIYSSDDALANKLEVLNAKRLEGSELYAVAQTDMAKFAKLEYFTTNAPYLVDKLIADRRDVFEDTLHVVGVCTPIEKGERMITNEVNTQNAEPAALIGILIKTFNNDAERQDAPFKLVYDAQQISFDISSGDNAAGGIVNVTGAEGVQNA